MEPWLTGLNEEQTSAVVHPGGPILVLAGAGSGKTATLAARVAHLVAGGVPAERILLLTFSRRAAREMLSRAGVLAAAATGSVWGGTFHAVANRLLRLHGRALGLPPDFTVLDQGDAADLMNLIRGDLGLGERGRRFPKKETLAAAYSRAVNAGARLPDVLRTAFPWCADDAAEIAEVFRLYVDRKRASNVLDFDDLLVFWRALASSPAAGPSAATRFEHILVDEYQDTNPLQADILAAMHGSVPNVMVVGDDAQSIYSFRSATVRNILEFPARFPGAAVVRLERNYRSTPPVIAAANAVIERSPLRHDKTMRAVRGGGRRPVLVTCRDEAEQAEAVCRRILEQRERGVPLREQAVLFRTGHHSDLLEVELARRNIPFVKYGGLRFLESAHVKDTLALLRVLENPHDEVGWFRVLQLLDGVGPARARRAMEELGVGGRGAADGEAGSPLARFAERGATGLPAETRAEADALRDALGHCSQPGVPVSSQIERLRRFLEPAFRRRYDDVPSRLRDVEHLEALASRFGSRDRLLAELALDPPSSTSDLAGPPFLDDDYVVLSTMHSAKGCEWRSVHVIHAADGMIPSDMATGDAESVEEERRLFYVALTRARDDLAVYFPLRYYRRPRTLDDPHGYAQATRFLHPEARALFDEEPGGDEPDAGPAPGTTGMAGTPWHPDAFLAALWDPGALAPAGSGGLPSERERRSTPGGHNAPSTRS